MKEMRITLTTSSNRRSRWLSPSPTPNTKPSTTSLLLVREARDPQVRRAEPRAGRRAERRGRRGAGGAGRDRRRARRARTTHRRGGGGARARRDGARQARRGDARERAAARAWTRSARSGDARRSRASSAPRRSAEAASEHDVDELSRWLVSLARRVDGLKADDDKVMALPHDPRLPPGCTRRRACNCRSSTSCSAASPSSPTASRRR